MIDANSLIYATFGAYQASDFDSRLHYEGMQKHNPSLQQKAIQALAMMNSSPYSLTCQPTPKEIAAEIRSRHPEMQVRRIRP